MAIPASEIVSVNPRLIKAGASDLAINGLLLSTSTLIPLSAMVLSFSNADAVGDYFGTNSDEYTAASKYFLGYNNSFTKPRAFLIARRVNESISAWLRGAPYTGSLASLKAITTGSLSLEIDGIKVTATDMNLSGATSFSDVAQIIQTAISTTVSGTSVSYSSLNKGFTIMSPTVGSDSSITYASPAESGVDLATLLGLTEGSGASLSGGSDSMTVADNFAAIRTRNDNWVTFTTTWEATEEEALELAEWAGDKGVDFLYVCWSTAEGLKLTGTTTIAEALKDAHVAATTGVYGDMKLAAFVMGTAASIDWNRNNGVINFAFKGQPGQPNTAANSTEANTLLARGWNFYGTYATRNDEFTFFYDGHMYGDYKFIDPYINAVWFKNVIQASVMNGLTMAGRVPYTDEGYTLIRGWCMDPVNRAYRNGVIDTGVTMSESQKAQLVSELGYDASEELFSNGYVLDISDPGASVRVDRDSPTISLYYTYGGSVNKIVISSTMLV